MRLIIVAGMHRSGTSYLTELLHTMGAAVGDDLLEPAADNPHGFFERRDVKRVNDAVLNHLGGSWDRPPTGLSASWATSHGLDRLRQSAEALLSDLFDEAAGSDACVVKDPRFSLTAPFWNSVVAADTTIVPLRDPREVAQSLRHRNGVAPTRAASLWLRYMLGAVLELPDPHLISLTELSSDPEHVVAQLADIAGLHGDVDRASGIALARGRTWQPVDAFRSTSDDPTMRLADAVFRVLQHGEPVGAIAPVLQEIAERWKAKPLADIEALADGDRTRLGDAAAARILELHRQLEEARVSSVDLRDERDQVRRELRSTTQQAATAANVSEERIRSIQAQLTEREQQLHGVQQQLRDAQQQLDDARTRRAETDQQLDDERTRRTEAERAASEHEQRLKTEQAQRTAVERQNEEVARRARAAERNFERLKSRRIVRVALRMTRPLRPVVQFGRQIRHPRSTRAGSSRGGGDGDDAPSRVPSASQCFWSDIVGRLTNATGVTVVVPVYNAADEVERCLEQLIAWTPRNVGVLVIDDASPEPEVAPVLERFAAQPNVQVLRNDTNLGFTRTVNRGFESCTGDVVILNSDARVSPNWLVNLRIAAYSRDRVASASATSDNAGAFSLPEPGPNHLPGLNEVSLARMHLQRSSRRWPSSPTGHGFCMYLRRAALDEVGNFDADHFPRGYGEENDWSMRAVAAGWEHVVDDSTMVFHSNAASFDPAVKSDLVTRARRQVDLLHPTYTQRVRAFLQDEMEPVRCDAREIHAAALRLVEADAMASVRPRLLSVVQDGRGGTPETNRDLMRALEPHYEPWILTSDSRWVRLHQVIDGTPQLVEEVETTAPLGSNRQSEPVYREFVARVILSMGFEVVHVRHLFKHAQDDIPDILFAAGLPSVLSLHDFYWVCPNVHLLDENGRYCGGNCTPGPGDCSHPMAGRRPPMPLKHHWVYDWRRSIRRRFDAFDQFVTTSASAHSVLAEHYPELDARGINVIPHGRDLANYRTVAVEPEPSDIRIAVIGNLSRAKGGDFLRRLLALDIDHVLDIHVLGDVESEFSDLRCTFHGPYRREELADLVAPIRPAFGALLSVWPETWSHTLTEAWSMGLPVLVSGLGGALRERVEQHGGGWVIDTDDPQSAYDLITAISSEPSRWRQVVRSATVEHLPSLDEMADRYRVVYRAARARSELDRTVVDLRVVTDGAGRSPGSAHVRALRRFAHPAVRRSVITQTALGSSPSIKSAIPNIIWVERTAIGPEDLELILHERARHRSHLIVDLDDDLVNADHLPRKFARSVPTMRRLLGEADLVTVSTPALVEVVAPLATRVELLPNQLDETIWFPTGENGVPRKPIDGTLDVLYMGTETHAGDLELVREPFERLAAERGGAARLWVIGGAPPRSDEWFQRVSVPDDAKEYPSFVAWLRSIGDRWDFAIAPLEDTPFTQSKSDLKFLEYAALGLPAVVSDVDAYRHTVSHGHDGYVTDNDPDAWFRALVTMSSRQHQDELRFNALRNVKARTIAATAETFVSLLRDIV